MLVASVLPSVLYIILMGNRISKAEKAANVVIATIASIIMIVCTVVSFKTLMSSFK